MRPRDFTTEFNPKQTKWVALRRGLGIRALELVPRRLALPKQTWSLFYSQAIVARSVCEGRHFQVPRFFGGSAHTSGTCDAKVSQPVGAALHLRRSQGRRRGTTVLLRGEHTRLVRSGSLKSGSATTHRSSCRICSRGQGH